MRKLISEIIEEASKKETKEEKINYLKENDSVPLRTILQYTYHPAIKWLLPKGNVPYKPSKDHGLENSLYHECRKLYLFVEGGNPNLTSQKREILFIDLMQNIHPKDAVMLECVKDKKLHVDGLNKRIVNAAFPGVIKDE